MIIAITLTYGDSMLLRHIRYLLAVADHGNFTRAAEALHVSQPALSQQIRQLESSLGVQLFDRTRRSVVPTDAGRVYLDHARRCLLELEAGKRALNDVSDLSRGHLRLGVTPTFSEYLIAPLIDRFSALYPGVAIILTELPLERITEALISDSLDLAIGFAGSHAVEIDSQPLFDEQLCLVMAKSAPEKQTVLTLEDLQTLRFALLAPGFATRQLLDAWCHTQNFKPTVGLEANSIAILLKVVAQGRMATILPDAIVREQPGLCEVQTIPALPGRTVALLRRKNGYQSAAANAFAKLVSNSTQT
ncbi:MULTISPECIES: transcriptional regulator CynR [Pseudomonas]|uniref:transcriptional regulator CynR n=1 Tax=Pseudomonas TaxID=286 RepID=UPI00090912EA|nr:MULTISPECIES: transcriptional regulator CynR [Pseudomonas]MDU8617387.1 transcriptional regulator CynR [Pseudomonas syringae]SFW83150.1 LysR family transcriptional regulator, cyn operon transcriptional activator [Pseudomonas sp. NFACC10-1]